MAKTMKTAKSGRPRKINSPFYCQEHKRQFKGGQGFAAHLRRWHSLKFPAKPALKVTQAESSTEISHLQSALGCLDVEIGLRQGELERLDMRRNFILRALDHAGVKL